MGIRHGEGPSTEEQPLPPTLGSVLVLRLRQAQERWANVLKSKEACYLQPTLKCLWKKQDTKIIFKRKVRLKGVD